MVPSWRDSIRELCADFVPNTLEAVIETDIADDPYTFRDLMVSVQAIAANLGTFLESEIQSNPMFSSSVSLQFGVGRLGNVFMGALTDFEFGDDEVIYFGEVFQDGLLEMFDAGQLAEVSATSLSLSTAKQERFFDESDRYAEDIVLHPADLSNNPTLIERFSVVGVNSAIEVNCYGNANATHVGSTRIVSGIGDGSDFVRNSRLLVIVLLSTAAGSDIPRIVPMTPHVDHLEHEISVVVTEHGVADLRGCSPCERATKMVEIANPTFRDDLDTYRTRSMAGGGQTPQFGDRLRLAH